LELIFIFEVFFYRQKQLENKAALSLLQERLDSLAKMDWEERQVNLATGESDAGQPWYR